MVRLSGINKQLCDVFMDLVLTRQTDTHTYTPNQQITTTRAEEFKNMFIMDHLVRNIANSVRNSRLEANMESWKWTLAFYFKNLLNSFNIMPEVKKLDRMSSTTQLASASTMDRLSLYMGTCCRVWIGLYLALCCLTSVTSMMLHVAAVGLLLCILSYFRLPAPEPGEVFRILGKLLVTNFLLKVCID